MSTALLEDFSDDSEDLQSTEKTQKSIQFWKLYRYATCLDVLTLILATIFSILAGISYPILIYILGITLTDFVDYAIIQRIKDENSTNDDYFCNISERSNLQDFYDSNDPANILQDRTANHTYYTISISLALFLSAFLSRFLWRVSASRQTRKMRLDYFKSVLTRHVGWFDLNFSTDTHIHLSQSIQTIETAIGHSVAIIIINCITFISCFVIAFIVNWKLTAVTGSLLPVLFGFACIIGKIISIFTVRKQNALVKAGLVAEEVLSSIKTVKAFSGQETEVERYHSHLKQAKRESYVVLILISVIFSIFSMMIGMFQAVGFWYGADLFVDCSITSGEIFLIITEVFVGSFILADIAPELTELFLAIRSASVVYAVIDQKPEINPDSSEGIFPGSCEGSIQFSDVIFSYPSRPDVQILHGLDLSIKPGQSVALVGPTGCGKSTISKLIPRLYDINGGNISLDGIDIQDLKISWLRNQISIVSQEPVLFNVSIAENISYGKEDATIEEIEMAAKFANAHDFISELPDGYNTLVGEGGSQLSGGQKQRVAIARALVKDPKILLLDEATSDLDSESENVVQDVLDKAMEGRTTIIIAHRLSTIQMADVIIGIDNGRVVEMGSHNELMKREGLYYQLVMNQLTEESTRGEDFTPALRKKIHLQSMSIEAPFGGSYMSTDKLPENLGQDVDFTEVYQESTEDSPLIQPKVSTSSDRHALSIFKQLMVLCFNKVYWISLLFAILLLSSSGVVFAIMYYLLHGIVESLSRTDSDEVLRGVHLYAIIFIALSLSQLFLASTSITSLGACEEQICETVRLKSFKAILKQNMGWFDRPQNSVGILTHRLLVEASNIIQAFDVKFGQSFRSAIVVIASIVIAFIVSWAVALVVTPAFPLMFLGGFIQVILTKRYTDKRNKLIKDSAKVAIEAVENVYTVATLGIERRLVRKYDQLLKLPFRYDLKSSTVNSIMYGFSQAILPVFIGLGYIFGAFLYTSDKDKVYYADYADIFTVILTVWFTGEVVKRFFDVLPDTQTAALSAKHFLVLMSQPATVENLSENGIIPFEVKGDLQMQKIYFNYPAHHEVTVLKDFNISITPGHTLALVGPSGSGKSTVISLIERFYDATSGSILLDGVELHELNIFWLRRQISLVSQEPVLFNMSIADNIRYGALFREVSDEEVIEAAKSANIHYFIQSLPEGYNTNVGFKGTQLSGGQKQQVAIARALVRDPKILLLEATSALDRESEKVVQDAIDKARKGRSTIIVAHRLSTAYNSDSIIVLHKGHVIEQGTHSELMTQQGLYYLMNQVQKQEF